jgi:hypothetical protein
MAGRGRGADRPGEWQWHPTGLARVTPREISGCLGRPCRGDEVAPITAFVSFGSRRGATVPGALGARRLFDRLTRYGRDKHSATMGKDRNRKHLGRASNVPRFGCSKEAKYRSTSLFDIRLSYHKPQFRPSGRTAVTGQRFTMAAPGPLSADPAAPAAAPVRLAAHHLLAMSRRV